MENYCLPPKLAGAFINALKDGTITPQKLIGMSSEGRRKLFADIIGDDNAREVNAMLEDKLLRKDQIKGLTAWAKQVAGVNEVRRADIMDQIKKVEASVFTPSGDFLADLAHRKLGVSVSADEAREIFNLSTIAREREAAAAKDPRPETWTAYGNAKIDLDDKIASFKPNNPTLSDRILDIVNAPKTSQTGFLHFSALGVQMYGVITSAEAWKGYAQSMSYFADEENYRNLLGYIVGHPEYPNAVAAGLPIPRLGQKLSALEEGYQSNLLERMNEALKQQGIVPFNVYRASSRAFNGALANTRFNLFTNWIEAARLNGEDVSVGSQASKEIAHMIGNFTGRADLKTFGMNDSNQVFLNTVFFAPRKLAATMQMFNPLNYMRFGEIGTQSATARHFAIRQMSGTLMATGTFLSLLHMAGVNVDFDPRSQDFLKPQIGGVKFDITGGNAIFARLLARVFTGEKISSRGKLVELGQGYKPQTSADMITDFLRGKLSPTGSVLADKLYGKDMAGAPFSVPHELYEHVTPISLKSFIDFFYSNADHLVAALPTLSAFLGVGVESPLPQLGKNKFTVWGQPNDKPWQDRPSDPVDQAYSRIGVTPGYPPQKLRGVKLTDDQYAQYQQLYGQMTHQHVLQKLRPGFENLSFGAQQEIITKAHEEGAKQADKYFFSHNLQTLEPAVKAHKELVKQQGSDAARATRAKQ